MTTTDQTSGSQQPEEEAHDHAGGAGGRRASRELIATGMEPATATSILMIETAFSLSMAMMNAVNQQRSQWSIAESITIAGANLLLRTDILDDAVDRLLGPEPPQQHAGSAR